MKDFEKYMKKLVGETVASIENFFLNNLDEKSQDLWYIDAKWKMKDVPKIFDDIANDLTDSVLKYEFREDDPDTLHPFIECSEDLASAIGFESITICPYKGPTIVPYLQSNYMVMETGGSKNITIDIYNTIALSKDRIYKLIITELFNLKRELEWINEGTYEDNMLKMVKAFSAFTNVVGFA